MKTYPHLTGIGRLVRVGARFCQSAALDCPHLSLPLPVPGPQGLRVLFLYCATRPPGPGSGILEPEISQPQFMVAFDAETGKFLELAPFVPAAWGLPARAGWNVVVRPGGNGATEGFQGKVAELFQSLDRLLGPFAGGCVSLPQQEQILAGKMLALFRDVAESCLLDTYYEVGRVFFDWLRRVLRP